MVISPEQLLDEVDAVPNEITAARFGDPPDGMVAGMLPTGIVTGGQVCSPKDSVIGPQLHEDLGPAALLPTPRSDFAASLGGPEPLTPTEPSVKLGLTS